MTRKQLLEEAEKCVCHDRNNQYGGSENNFAIVAKYWTTYLSVEFGINPEEIELKPENIGIMMTLFKIVRIQTGVPKNDNYIDGIGYLACAGEITLGNVGVIVEIERGEQ